MSFILTIITNALALLAVVQLLEGFHVNGGWLAYVVAGATIAFLNIIIKPILNLFAFPLVFLTAGLFSIVINAVILYLAQYVLQVMDIEGVHILVDNHLTYLLATLIFGISNSIINWFLKE